MARVITQEMYDEVVRENIDKLSMSPEEAIKEAVAQFEAQGLNLANITKDLALSSCNVSKAVANLKNISSDGHLDALMEECKKSLAHRMKAGKDGAYKILLEILETKNKTVPELTFYPGWPNRPRRSRFPESEKVKVENPKKKTVFWRVSTRLFIAKVLYTLIALMDNQPDLLDDEGVDLIKRLLEKYVDHTPIYIATLKWISTCCLKHEQNRQALLSKDIAAHLKQVLTENDKNTQVLSEISKVIRELGLDDDVRV